MDMWDLMCHSYTLSFLLFLWVHRMEMLLLMQLYLLMDLFLAHGSFECIFYVLYQDISQI